jgi:DNA-binding NarL/FixJ family response regulator
MHLMMEGIGVVIADDHLMVLDGLCELIDGTPDLRVVATATDGESAVRVALAHRPRVVVLDVRMPRCDGLEATRRILEVHPEIRVLLLSGAADPSLAVEAFRAGAAGFAPKSAYGSQLLEGIRAVARGETYAPPEILPMIAATLREARPVDETDKHILRLVADGATNEHIAHELGTSLGSIKARLASLFDELGARDRASLVAAGFRRGILS